MFEDISQALRKRAGIGMLVIPRIDYEFRPYLADIFYARLLEKIAEIHFEPAEYPGGLVALGASSASIRKRRKDFPEGVDFDSVPENLKDSVRYSFRIARLLALRKEAEEMGIAKHLDKLCEDRLRYVEYAMNDKELAMASAELFALGCKKWDWRINDLTSVGKEMLWKMIDVLKGIREDIRESADMFHTAFKECMRILAGLVPEYEVSEIRGGEYTVLVVK